jgi:NAD(P)-dependent dehydrogenase (short-subunit alcohol dehydrogenase family)
MDIEGCTALVTGANRGLGKAYVEALLSTGAPKVYAAARDPSSIADPRVMPIRLDVTSPSGNRSHSLPSGRQLCGDAGQR